MHNKVNSLIIEEDGCDDLFPTVYFVVEVQLVMLVPFALFVDCCK